MFDRCIHGSLKGGTIPNFMQISSMLTQASYTNPGLYLYAIEYTVKAAFTRSDSRTLHAQHLPLWSMSAIFSVVIVGSPRLGNVLSASFCLHLPCWNCDSLQRLRAGALLLRNTPEL